MLALKVGLGVQFDDVRYMHIISLITDVTIILQHRFVCTHRLGGVALPVTI